MRNKYFVSEIWSEILDISCTSTRTRTKTSQQIINKNCQLKMGLKIGRYWNNWLSVTFGKIREKGVPIFRIAPYLIVGKRIRLIFATPAKPDLAIIEISCFAPIWPSSVFVSIRENAYVQHFGVHVYVPEAGINISYLSGTYNILIILTSNTNI